MMDQQMRIEAQPCERARMSLAGRGGFGLDSGVCWPKCVQSGLRRRGEVAAMDEVSRHRRWYLDARRGMQ